MTTGQIQIPIIPKEIVKKIKDEAKTYEEYVSSLMKKKYYESILNEFSKQEVPEEIGDLGEIEKALVKGLKYRAFLMGLGMAKEEEKEGEEVQPQAQPQATHVEKVKTEEEIVADIIAKLVKEGMKPEDATKIAFRILNRGKEEGMGLDEIAKSYRELMNDIKEITKFKLELLKEDLSRLREQAQSGGASDEVVSVLMAQMEELRNELKKMREEKEKSELQKLIEAFNKRIDEIREEVQRMKAEASTGGQITTVSKEVVENLRNQINDMVEALKLLGFRVEAPKGKSEVLVSEKEMELRREIEMLRRELRELKESTRITRHIDEFVGGMLELAFKDPAKFRDVVNSFKELIGTIKGGQVEVKEVPKSQLPSLGIPINIKPETIEKVEKEMEKPEKIGIDFGGVEVGNATKKASR